MRIGLVGTGYWARTVHGPSAATHPRLTFSGVWGRDAAKAGEVASGFGVRGYAKYEEFLQDVDALTFAIPPDAQADLALRAAQRGKHLLLEKPIALSVGSALELEQAVARAGVASIVFVTRRFTSATADWLERVAEIGGWDCARAEFCARIFGGPFENSQWRRAKGALWDVGPHAMSLLWPIMGSVASVIAGSGRGDQVHVVLRHTNGASSTMSLSMTVPSKATGNLVYFYGEAGRETLHHTPLETGQVVATHRRALDALIDQVQHPAGGHPCDVHFGARVVEVLAAAEQSLASQRAAQVALVPARG